MPNNDYIQPNINDTLAEAAIKITLQDIRRKWRDATGDDLELERIEKMRLGSVLKKLYPNGVRLQMSIHNMEERLKSVKHGWGSS